MLQFLVLTVNSDRFHINEALSEALYHEFVCIDGCSLASQYSHNSFAYAALLCSWLDVAIQSIVWVASMLAALFYVIVTYCNYLLSTDSRALSCHRTFSCENT